MARPILIFCAPISAIRGPDSIRRVATTNNYRAKLAYQLDLTKESSWINWLGRHSFNGYGEYRAIQSARFGYHDTVSSDQTWISATGFPASRNSTGYPAVPALPLRRCERLERRLRREGPRAPPYTTTLRYFNGVTNSGSMNP